LPGSRCTVHSALARLPLATLYVTDRCNSRCRSCDYWRHGRDDLRLADVERLLPSFASLGTQVVLLSGGEPLLNPEWAPIAQTLRAAALKVWLLTAGLALAKHAPRVARLIDSVTVSLDGADAQTYAAIRGLDAFDKVCEGIRSTADLGLPPSLRVTIQRANYRQLPAFVELAKRLGAGSVSFLAVDVANAHAFGRDSGSIFDLALRADDLPVFAQVLDALERDHAADFSSRLIAESAVKLRRLHQYFAAVNGLAPYPAVRCNAPEFSAVIGATGRVQPCFFIPGPLQARLAGDASTAAGASDLAAALNSEAMRSLRAAIRAGARAECKTCVCTLFREGAAFSAASAAPPSEHAA
jgi:MoaA/NifB/PqqE/SkfB family radical SAM enzyme